MYIDRLDKELRLQLLLLLLLWVDAASMDRIEYVPNIGQITLSDVKPYCQSIFL